MVPTSDRFLGIIDKKGEPKLSQKLWQRMLLISLRNHKPIAIMNFGDDRQGSGANSALGQNVTKQAQ